LQSVVARDIQHVNRHGPAPAGCGFAAGCCGPVIFTLKGIYMNPQVGVNIFVMLSGLAIVALLFFLGRHIASEQHPVRRWATGIFKRNGLIQTARLAGLVLLAIVLSALTLLYS